MIVYGATWSQNMIASIPKSLANALNLVASIMPALGIGMLLNYIGKKKLIGFFFLGFFLTVYFKLDTMACFVFASCVAAVMYYFQNDTEEAE